MNLLSNLPYVVHTGQELHLMIAGVKPLAVFYDVYPAEHCEEIIPENAYEPYVRMGRFEKREFVELLDRPPPTTHRHLKGYRYVLYSTPEENWRIDAYIEMKAQAHVHGWSDTFERREGFLYGYEDWQTDAWIAYLLLQPQAKTVPWLKKLAAKRGD